MIATPNIIEDRTAIEDRKKILLIVVHGIRTWAEWATTLEDELSDNQDVRVVPIGYGYFDAIQFLCPVYFRMKAVAVARDKIRNALTNYPGHEVVVIAHSFGSFVLTRAMANGDIRPDRIVLCGSVLKQSFNWDALPGAPSVDSKTGLPTIVNDCGDLDWWPVLATFATVGFGTAGTSGFKTSRVQDRHHRLGHSDYLSTAKPAAWWQRHKKNVLKGTDEREALSGRHFMRRFWVPFVMQGEIIRPDYTAERYSAPWAMGLLVLFRVRNLLVFCLIGLTVYCFREPLQDTATRLKDRLLGGSTVIATPDSFPDPSSLFSDKPTPSQVAEAEEAVVGQTYVLEYRNGTDIRGDLLVVDFSGVYGGGAAWRELPIEPNSPGFQKYARFSAHPGFLGFAIRFRDGTIFPISCVNVAEPNRRKLVLLGSRESLLLNWEPSP